MPLSSWTTIGTIVKPHGTKGGFVAVLRVDADYIEELDKIWMCYPGQDRVPYRIAECRQSVSAGNRQLFFVRLEGIDNRDASEQLRGRDLLSNEPIPVEEKEPDTIGYIVLREDQSKLGFVEDIIPTAGAPVFVVKSGEKQVLIPDVDVYVSRVNHEANQVVVKNTTELEEL